MSTYSSNQFKENSNKNFSFIFPSFSLQNAKYFLETYKTSKNNSLFFQKFIKECHLNAKDSQIPDTFYKLHKPLDRNLVFYICMDHIALEEIPITPINLTKIFIQNIP